MKQNLSTDVTLTKQEFLAALRDLKSEILIKIDESELRNEDRARERQSQILTKFDEWAGEIETARDDRILTTKQLKDHENRIKKLEDIQN